MKKSNDDDDSVSLVNDGLVNNDDDNVEVNDNDDNDG